METFVLFFRGLLGDSFFRKRDYVRSTWFFCQKTAEKVWGATHLCLLWTIWKERDRRSFENEEFSYQRLKILFLGNLLSRTKLFIAESSMSFFDWLGSVWGNKWFFVFPFPFFSTFWRSLYTSYVLQCAPFWCFSISFLFTYQKKS